MGSARRTRTGRGPAPRGIDLQLRDDLDGFDGMQVVMPMTCMRDRREHAVTEFEFIHAGRCGRYRAVCGAPVLPGSLAEPPGSPCPSCLARLRPHPAAERTRSALARLRLAARRVLGRVAGESITRERQALLSQR